MDGTVCPLRFQEDMYPLPLSLPLMSPAVATQPTEYDHNDVSGTATVTMQPCPIFTAVDLSIDLYVVLGRNNR